MIDPQALYVATFAASFSALIRERDRPGFPVSEVSRKLAYKISREHAQMAIDQHEKEQAHEG